MIRRIEIKGFKSCEDLSLEGLGPFTVLVGRNGVGKSNILKAISWAAKSATSATMVEHPRARTQDKSQFGITISLLINNIGYDYEIRFLHIFDESLNGLPGEPIVTLNEKVTLTHPGETKKVAFERRGESIEVTGRQAIPLPSLAPALTFISSLMPQGDSLRDEVRPLFDFLRNIKYYNFDDPFIQNDTILNQQFQDWLLKSNSSRFQSNDSVWMRIVLMYFQRPDGFDELKSLLGVDGLGLIEDIQIDSVEIPSAPNDQGSPSPQKQKLHFVRFRPANPPRGDDGPRGFELDDLSVGTRRVLQILVSLLFDKSSVMLIEHPEDGIHSRLARKLIGVLKSYADPSQLIIASHSSVVFDELEPEEIRLVSMNEGRTEARSLSSDEIQAAHRYINEDGPLSSFLELTQSE